MSMLSAQVDKLRELATRYDELQVGAVKEVTMPSDMGSVLRDAADTIWELRDDLQRTNAENARLRSELESVGTAAYLYGRSDLNDENAKLREIIADLEELLPESKRRWHIHETVKAIAEDNAKLRELVRELYEIAQPEAPSMFETEFAGRMRELGVEVDG